MIAEKPQRMIFADEAQTMLDSADKLCIEGALLMRLSNELKLEALQKQDKAAEIIRTLKECGYGGRRA